MPTTKVKSQVHLIGNKRDNLCEQRGTDQQAKSQKKKNNNNKNSITALICDMHILYSSMQ